jgi:hypothetical protein
LKAQSDRAKASSSFPDLAALEKRQNIHFRAGKNSPFSLESIFLVFVDSGSDSGIKKGVAEKIERPRNDNSGVVPGLQGSDQSDVSSHSRGQLNGKFEIFIPQKNFKILQFTRETGRVG